MAYESLEYRFRESCESTTANHVSLVTSLPDSNSRPPDYRGKGQGMADSVQINLKLSYILPVRHLSMP